MREEILKQIAELSAPGFFVITEFSRIGQEIPSGMEPFILEKLEAIKKGIQTRKFVFQQDEWRILFTFFPTDRVVEERYALKNKFLKMQR